AFDPDWLQHRREESLARPCDAAASLLPNRPRPSRPRQALSGFHNDQVLSRLKGPKASESSLNQQSRFDLKDVCGFYPTWQREARVWVGLEPTPQNSIPDNCGSFTFDLFGRKEPEFRPIGAVSVRVRQ